MPNWCGNSMTVKGVGRDIKGFIKDNYQIMENEHHSCDYTFSLERIAPTPLDKDGNLTEDWYNWRVNNWGTKWDVCEYHSTLSSKDVEGNPNLHTISVDDVNLIPDGSLDEATVYSSFETAWEPPLKVYDTLRGKYANNTLNFKTLYHEPGLEFAGRYDFAGGKVLVEEYYTTDSGDEDDMINYYEFLLDNDFESAENMVEWTEGQGIDEQLINYHVNEIKNAVGNRDKAIAYQKLNTELHDAEEVSSHTHYPSKSEVSYLNEDGTLKPFKDFVMIALKGSV